MFEVSDEFVVPFAAAMVGALAGGLIGGAINWWFHYLELRRLRRFELLRVSSQVIAVAHKFMPGLKRGFGMNGAKAFDKHRAFLLDRSYELILESRPVVVLAPRRHRKLLEHEIEGVADVLLNLSMKGDDDVGLSTYLSWLRAVLVHNPPNRITRELRLIRRKASEAWNLYFEADDRSPSGVQLPDYIPKNEFTRVPGDFRTIDWD